MQSVQLCDLYAPELFPVRLLEALGVVEQLPFDLWGAWPQQLFNMRPADAPLYFWKEVARGEHMDDLTQKQKAFIDLGRFGLYAPNGRIQSHEQTRNRTEGDQQTT